MKKNPFSRRKFLIGSSGIIVGLPLLDCLMNFAYGQTGPQLRFINTYYGSCTGNISLTDPSSYGVLSGPLKASFSALSPFISDLTLVSGLDFPIFLSNAQAIPGGAINKQHGGVESPLLSGVAAMEKVAPLIRGQTVDQIAADHLGSGSKYKSLQLRVQAAKYNGTTGSKAQDGSISLRSNNGVLNELPMIESPQKLYSMLFTSGVGVNPIANDIMVKNKSALDFVLEDANRLIRSVSSEERPRLEAHFDKIRDLERSLIANPTLPVNGCPSLSLTDPGNDPAISTYGFGGWADETQRGYAMVDMIAYALACDMTRVVSLAYSHFQTWINSQKTGGSNFAASSGIPDIHSDSHIATSDIIANNCNWAAGIFARLIGNLKNVDESTGTLLDHTYLTFVTAEAKNAHGKKNYTYIVAGLQDKVNLGMHINGQQKHPALVHLEGLRAIGKNTTALGQVSGSISGLLK